MRAATRGVILAASAAITYGTLGVLAKVAYAEGWSTPALLVARFGLAALLILPFALARRGAWRAMGGAFLVGALGYAATTALYFPSIRVLPAAVASFLLYLAPPIVAAISFVLFRERLGLRGVFAIALALAGLVLLALGAFTGALSIVGVLLACGSAVAYALTTLAARKVAGDAPWPWVSLGVALGACASYLVYGLVSDTLVAPATTRGILAAVGIGTLSGGIALSLFMAALPLAGASRTSVISTLEPVSTLVLAAVFLAEVPDVWGVLGGVLIVVAAALVALDQPAAAPHE